MKGNKYWDTIWSERDQEFVWSGMKIGFITSMILTSIIWIDGMMILSKVKESKHLKKD